MEKTARRMGLSSPMPMARKSPHNSHGTANSSSRRAWEKIEKNDIILRGDGNLSILETCAADHVIAEAISVIRGGKEIKVGSFKWKLYRYLWPDNPFLRRVALGVYRRVRE